MSKSLLNSSSVVAGYVRKSQDDGSEEDVLRKHRERLQELANRYGFKDVKWFEEVGTADTIAGRPVFMNLLPRIENGEFDAVMVIHVDRLTRGSQLEAGLVQNTFEESATLLVTPDKVYNFSNESDALLLEFQSVISRNELRAIKRRMRDGKKKATTDGKVHNGSVPFPYYWDKNLRQAVIDQDNLKIFRMMVNMYLKENKSFQEIAFTLNELNIKSPRGSIWQASAVSSILRNDFCAGYVFFNKFSSTKEIRDGRLHYRRHRAKGTEYFVSKGMHEPVISQEEYESIKKRVRLARAKLNWSQKTRRKNTHRLSGLVRCHHCGLVRNINFQNGKTFVTKCNRRGSPSRTPQCDHTKGVPEDTLYEAVLVHLRQYRDKLFAPIENDKGSEIERYNSLEELIKIQEDVISKSERKIEKYKEMYVDDIIQRDELKEVTKTESTKINKAKEKIDELTKSIDYISIAEQQNRIQVWETEEVEALLDGKESDPSTINDILKTLIQRIEFENHQVVKNEHHLKVKIVYA